MKTTKLYRPVNKVELDLIQDSNWKRFPPRLPEQPIFYPVTNQEYASQITTEWNVPSYQNGFVTEFELDSDYLSKFKIEKVGLDYFTELWVPSEILEEFNDQIIDDIRIIEAYHSNPENAYVLIKDVFKVREDWLIGIEFLNKNTDFKMFEGWKLGEMQLENYLDLPRKINKDGSSDLNTFLVKLKESDIELPFQTNSVELLTNALK